MLQTRVESSGLGPVRIAADDILEALGDKYSRAILLATMQKPMSIPELSEMLGIPLPTVYRKVKMLESRGLLEKEKLVLNRNLRWVYTYRSTICEVILKICAYGIEVLIVGRDGDKRR